MRGKTTALITLGCAALLVHPGLALTQDAPANTCAECHRALGGRLAEPAEQYEQDVHAEAGFACTACHGGDATVAGPEAMDPAKGYIGVPAATDIPQVCGRCHSNADFMKRYNPSLRVDQVAEYVTSVHGQQLLGAGDTLVATCASCHHPHLIRPAKDPRSTVYPLHVPETCGRCHADPEHMAPYGIPTDQLEKYQRSIHWEALSEGGDISAPVCNDCHGNHGAAPPGVSWVGNVCGECHVVMAENFAASRHAEAFTQLGIPGCAACHSNHEIHKTSDAMLGLSEGAVCRTCHSERDPGGQTAQALRATIDSLRVDLDSAQTVLEKAENAGMEVSGPLAELNDGRSSLIKARALVHSFNLEKVRTEAEAGQKISSSLLERGMEALHDLRTRRLGLAVSVVIIAILVVGLVLKIRDMEASPRPRNDRA